MGCDTMVALGPATRTPGRWRWCSTTAPRRSEFRFSGRGPLAVSTAGARVTLIAGSVCVASAPW